VTVTIRHGDCREVLRTLPDESVHCCVTSPPYFGLRDYGVAGQIGLEPTPADFIAELVDVFREVRRVLRSDGTVWLNLGDSYSTHAAGKIANPMAKSTLAGVKTQEVANASSRAQGAYRKDATLPEKNLMGIPWRVALALQADGWILRQDIIWSKPNPMPESVTDRCTKAHEYIFLLSKSARYFYDAKAIAELGVGRETYFGSDAYSKGSGRNDSGSYNDAPAQTRNKRSVWHVSTQPFSEAHFATFPPDLIEPCIKAGCPKGGMVLDPFGGAGTTGLVADRLGRDATLIELNPEYAEMARRRISGDAGMFADVTTSEVSSPTLPPTPEQSS
jgi:DNA modification methylase